MRITVSGGGALKDAASRLRAIADSLDAQMAKTVDALQSQVDAAARQGTPGASGFPAASASPVSSTPTAPTGTRATGGLFGPAQALVLSASHTGLGGAGRASGPGLLGLSHAGATLSPSGDVLATADAEPSDDQLSLLGGGWDDLGATVSDEIDNALQQDGST